MGATHAQRLDRARGALTGLAIGDALGMATQSMTYDDIVREYGEIRDFCAPLASNPYSAGLPAATVTDDTEQAQLVADLLILGRGDFDPYAFADALRAWEDSVRTRGLFDLLGPSTTRALAALAEGVPLERVGEGGNTNGAAMRIAPVGILYSTTDIAALVRTVRRVSELTHNSVDGVAAAAAVAGVVSAGVDGCSVDEALDIGRRACALAVEEFSSDRALLERFDRARELGLRGDDAKLRSEIGTSVLARESVFCAIGLVAHYGTDTWRGCCVAAGVGDDTDTIGALVGAMSGALSGYASLPSGHVRVLEQQNNLDFSSVATSLLEMRR